MKPALAKIRHSLDWITRPVSPHATKLLSGGDPVLQCLVSMFQGEVERKKTAKGPYAEMLAQSLLLYFLQRYAAPRRSQGEFCGGLSPYKLRRTMQYIKDHLAHKLSLITLAAVAETSPFHFARSFKFTTGYTPHQYVIKCRMERAKQLLAETDISLSEIGLQVGCADQSHFTALFRKYAFMTPKIYRDATKTEFSVKCRYSQETVDIRSTHTPVFREQRGFFSSSGQFSGKRSFHSDNLMSLNSRLDASSQPAMSWRHAFLSQRGSCLPKYGRRLMQAADQKGKKLLEIIAGEEGVFNIGLSNSSSEAALGAQDASAIVAAPK